MSNSHHYVSITVQNASDLNFKSRALGNPFCVLEIFGRKKATNYRRSTNFPSWNERIDMVTDVKPKSFRLICMDHVSPSKHKEIGSAQVSLDDGDFESHKIISAPLEHLNLAGGVEKVGDIFFQVNHKPISSDTRFHYSWNGVLSVHVNSLKNLPLYAQMLEKNSRLCLSLRLDSQQFTTLAKDLDKDEFNNHSGFFFVDTKNMRDEILEIELWLKKGGRNFLVGSRNYDLQKLIQSQKRKDNNIFLFEKVKNQEDFAQEEDHFKREMGVLSLSSKVHDRRDVENEICESLFREYDYDFDGRLDREETLTMLATLQPDLNFKELHCKVNRLTKNSEYLYGEDIHNFLKSSEAHNEPFLNLLIIATLRGRCFPSTAHLLRGVTYLPKSASEPYLVKDRETGVYLEEHIPAYLKLAEKAFNVVENDQEFASESRILMKRLAHRQKHLFDLRESRNEILPFSSVQKIDLGTLNRPLSEFKNFNQFYSRELSHERRPVKNPEKGSILISPADCRMTVCTNLDNSKLNLRSLLCNDSLAGKFQKGSAMFCRYAPCDAHSWSAPANGIVGSVIQIEGEGLPIHPKALGLGMVHRNRRMISELHTREFGTILLVAVGGLLSSEIVLKNKKLEEVSKGTQMGGLSFGDSHLLVLFEKSRVALDADLLQSSKKGAEMFVKANVRVGVALKPLTLRN